jgi:hypothetical protein
MVSRYCPLPGHGWKSAAKIYVGKPLGLVSFGTESMLVWHRCAFDPQREIALAGMGSQRGAERLRRAVFGFVLDFVLGLEPLLCSARDADGAKVSVSIL